MQTAKRIGIAKAVIICMVATIYLIFGLSPFQWEWPLRIFKNEASRTSTAFLQFRSPGIARTDQPPDWIKDVIHHGNLHISLEVRSAEKRQSGPARILTISQDPWLRNLTIGQEKSDLIVRMRHPRTSLNGMPAYVVEQVFVSPDWHQIEVSITATSLVINVDGHERLLTSLPDHTFSQWSHDYKLALGNELTFDRPWLGDIRTARVKVHDHWIDYMAPKALQIPTRVLVRNRDTRYQLIPFATEGREHHVIWDWIINLCGFMPLGLAMLLLPQSRPSLLSVTLSCAVVSATIEIGQLFLRGRVTSIDDLILNTLGGFLGAWIGLILIVRWRVWRRTS